MRRFTEWWERAVLSGPGLALVGTFLIYPLAAALPYGLYRWTGLEGTKAFVGLSQFRTVAQSPGFWHAAGRSLMFAVTASTLCILGATALTILAFATPERVRGWTRGLVVLPLALSGVVLGLATQIAVSTIVAGRGGSWLPADPFGSPLLAFGAIVLVDVWQGLGLAYVFITAALYRMPREYTDLAALHGLRGVRLHLVVTLPFLAPTLLVVWMLEVLHRTTAFDLAYVLTGGGPYFATELMAIHVYRRAIGGRTDGAVDLGEAAAAAFLFALLSAAVAAMAWRRLRHMDRGDP